MPEPNHTPSFLDLSLLLQYVNSCLEDLREGPREVREWSVVLFPDPTEMGMGLD